MQSWQPLSDPAHDADADAYGRLDGPAYDLDLTIYDLECSHEPEHEKTPTLGLWQRDDDAFRGRHRAPLVVYSPFTPFGFDATAKARAQTQTSSPLHPFATHASRWHWRRTAARTDSVDTTSTSTDLEDIELCAFGPAGRGRPCVGASTAAASAQAQAAGAVRAGLGGHVRFGSSTSTSGCSDSSASDASASTLSSAPASRSPSPPSRRQCESVSESVSVSRFQARSQARSQSQPQSQAKDEALLAYAVDDNHIDRDDDDDCDRAAFAVADPDPDTFPPMSPRSARYEHRKHLAHPHPHPQHARATDGEYDSDVEAQLSAGPMHPDSKSTLYPKHTTLDSTCSPPPLETDSLLRCSAPLGALPLPATTAATEYADPPMSFSALETSVHVLGIALVSFLCALSVWLTLARVKM